MSYAIDAADAKLLAAGEHAHLLAKYEPVILGRCIARLRGHADADDVAQDVKLRLWRELTAGKEYAVPFRVVVHQVIGWMIADYFGGRPTDVPLPEGWNAGDPNDPLGELLDRDAVAALLGEGREELAELVDAFLLWAEAPEPDEDAVAIAQAWLEGEAPLVALRVRRGVRREDVVDAIVARFGLAGLREKVARRYHELETGQIDARRADPALLDELGALLRTRVADLLAWRPRPLAAEATYFRAEAPVEAPAQALRRPAEEPDEVDRLFLAS